nr:MAG TPA: hypothetical protein [Caudoviricetes sp.]
MTGTAGRGLHGSRGDKGGARGPISPRAFFLRACAREGASGYALPRTIWQWEGWRKNRGRASLYV